MSEGWKIVYFIDEESVEAVPEQWIQQSGEEMYSFWPNIRSTTKIMTAIKSKQIPQKEWNKHKCKILSSKVYNNFTKASMKANKATYTDNIASQSECEEYTLEKRHIRKPSRYEDDSDSSAVDDSYGGLHTQSCSKRPIPRNESSDSGEDTLIDLPVPLKGTTVIPDMETLSHNNNAASSAQQKEAFKSIPHSIETSSNSSMSSVSIQHSEEYRQIIKQLHILNNRMQEQSNLILALINKYDAPYILENKCEENEELFEEGPIKNAEELQVFETKLCNDKLLAVAIKKFARVGGDDVRDLIRRVMPRIICDHLLMEYSWIGGKGKKKFALLKIPDLIKGICRICSNTKQETEKKIEICLALYLTKASEREQRREKRRCEKLAT